MVCCRDFTQKMIEMQIYPNVFTGMGKLESAGKNDGTAPYQAGPQ